MKKILMLGAAISLISGMALAETSPGAPTLTASDGVRQVKVDGDRPGKGEWKRHGKHHASRDGHRPRHRDFGPPSEGAHIILERHGSRIDVKCAENDTTQQCVEAVNSLMAQAAAKLGRGGRDGGPGPAPEGTPAPQQ